MKFHKKRVLVTGGAGFIGSHIAERLVKEGSKVIILDNFCTGKESNLEKIRNDIELIKGTINSYDDVEKSVKDCDIVIHQAFPYGTVGMGLDQQHIEEGAIGTFNVLKASVKNKVEKVVFASSVAVYGIPKYLPIDEKHPTDPFLPYGATKYLGELFCRTFSRIYKIDTVSLRYLYAYGPKYAQFDHSAIVNFLNRAIEGKPLLIYGDGSQIRDYSYIDDVVDGTILATMKENTEGDVYNISSGGGIRIIDLAKKIAKIFDNKIEVRFAEKGEYVFSDEYVKVPVGATRKVGDKWIDERSYSGDISKAKKELGYNPKIGLDEGISKTVKWLESIGKK